MPQAAPKPCTQCGSLVRDGSARCALHKAGAWRKTTPYKRESGRRLQRKREALFTAEPLCRECKLNGRVTLAEVRDHITPLAEGGLDIDDNVQPLCEPCHDEKTQQESARGVRRGGGH